MTLAYIGCHCLQYDPTCSICRATRAAYKAGRRAYRQGRSSRAKHGHHAFHISWTRGWDDGRKANPNTAARRAKEEALRREVEVERLRRERTKLDRQIKDLTS